MEDENAFVCYQGEGNSALCTIPRCLRYFAKQQPAKEAVVFVAPNMTREVVTFQEMYNKSEKVAHALVALGVKPLESVAISLPNCPEWLYTAFGAMMAGTYPVVLPFKYADGSDLIAIMDNVKLCSCLVFHTGVANNTWNILSQFLDEHSNDGRVSSRQMPALRCMFCVDPSQSLSEVMSFHDLFQHEATVTILPEVSKDDIAIIFQTSGSTGLAKLVPYRHASIMAFSNFDIGPKIQHDDIYFSVSHFGWSNGFPYRLFTGHTRVAVLDGPPKTEDIPAFLVDVIVRERCSVMKGTPEELYYIQKKKDYIKDDWPLKTAIVGGQPINKRVVSSLMPICKYIVVVYGSTECICISFNLLLDSEKYVDNDCGLTIPCIEVKIVDSDGKPVQSNTMGEIYVKGPNIFLGYFNDPGMTKTAFADGEWFKTDDLGRMTEDGSLLVEGRKGNIINSAGVKVFPEIMEKMLSKCPGVRAIVVVPVPDDIMHQAICACVEVVPGSSVDEDIIRKFCNDIHVDKEFTVQPKYYIILKAFPKTPTGKVSRQSLISMATELFKK